MSNTLITTIYDETVESDVHIEIEWEFDSQPNGRPDPRDSFSEGYDIVPEVLSVKVIEIVNPPVDMDKDLYMAWFQNFENKYQEEAKDLVQEYVDSQEEDFDIPDDDDGTY